MASVTHRKVTSGLVNPLVEVDLAAWNDTHVGLENIDSSPFLITNPLYGASTSIISNDNGPAIQAAFNAAGLVNGTVVIPSGNFRILTGVVATAGANLLGLGKSSEFTYNGTGVGLTVAGGGIDTMFIRGVNFVTNDTVSAIGLKVYGVNAELDIQGNKFTGGRRSIQIVGNPGAGSYGIDISCNNFEGNASTTLAIDIAPATSGYAQAIHVHHNNFSGFNQAVRHTSCDSLSIHHNRIERHFAATAPAIHTDTSNGVSISYNYFEDENSNQVMIESGFAVNALIVEGNRFYLNVGGGTNTGANALIATSPAGSITFSNNYIQALSGSCVVGNIVDTGASPIYGRANTFNIGTLGASYGFASTATPANVDIDGTKIISGSFSSGIQQVGVSRMASDGSNGSIRVGTTGLTNGTSSRVLYDNAGTLGEYTQAQVGNLVASVANTYTAAQTFNNGFFNLAGATSGALTQKAAAVAGASAITWPAGTTDFSATGGASQVVKQTSAGAALTVAPLTASDLPTIYGLNSFTTSGTFTTPVDSSTSTVWRITLVGGGGGGGGGNTNFTSGGGGGAGGTCIYVGSGVAGSTGIPYTVGANGTGGAGAFSGTNGTASTLTFNGTALTAAGGSSGGAGTASGPAGAGGAGGTTTNAIIGITGQAGSSGGTGSASNSGANQGGSSNFGLGGIAASNNIGPLNGGAATGFGAGGGGGVQGSGAGGNGAGGLVMFERMSK